MTHLPRGPRARSASVIAAGAFLAHQHSVSWRAAGEPRGADLIQQWHSVLVHSIPVLAGVVIACLTVRLINQGDGRRRTGATRGRAAAFAYAGAIIAVLFTQQLIEGALLAGHVGGLAAIFAAGGWAAVPLSAIFGLIAAVVDRGIEAAERLALTLFTTPARGAGASLNVTPRQHLTQRPTSPLASGFARRPPPSLA